MGSLPVGEEGLRPSPQSLVIGRQMLPKSRQDLPVLGGKTCRVGRVCRFSGEAAFRRSSPHEGRSLPEWVAKLAERGRSLPERGAKLAERGRSLPEPGAKLANRMGSLPIHGQRAVSLRLARKCKKVPRNIPASRCSPGALGRPLPNCYHGRRRVADHGAAAAPRPHALLSAVIAVVRSPPVAWA